MAREARNLWARRRERYVGEVLLFCRWGDDIQVAQGARVRALLDGGSARVGVSAMSEWV